MRQKTLVENSIYSVIYQVFAILLPLISGIYVARVLSVEGVGKVGVAQNFVSYFTLLAPLGIPAYGTREIAKLRGRDEDKNLLFSELFFLNLISTLIFTLLYILIILHFPVYAGELKLYLACGLSLVFNLINVDWIYQGEEEYGYITARSVMCKAVSLLFLFLFVKASENYVRYALISVFAACGGWIFSIFHVRKYVHIKFRGIRLIRHLPFLGIFVASSMLGSIYSKLDISMLGAIAGNVSAGYYIYAFRIAEILIIGCISITAVFMPRLSLLYEKDISEFYRILDLGSRILIFLSFPIMIGTVLLSEDIIYLLFGQDFMPAALPLRMLSPLIVIRSVGDLLCYQLLLCTRNESRKLPAYFVGAVLNFILNYLLIPMIKENGAVIATVFTELLIQLMTYYSMKKLMEIPLDGQAVRQAVLSSLLMSILLVIIYRKLPLGLYRIIYISISGMLSYILINIIMKNRLANDALTYLIRKRGGK